VPRIPPPPRIPLEPYFVPQSQYQTHLDYDSFTASYDGLCPVLSNLRPRNRPTYLAPTIRTATVRTSTVMLGGCCGNHSGYRRVRGWCDPTREPVSRPTWTCSALATVTWQPSAARPSVGTKMCGGIYDDKGCYGAERTIAMAAMRSRLLSMCPSSSKKGVRCVQKYSPK
jgi:hypothetical protein